LLEKIDYENSIKNSSIDSYKDFLLKYENSAFKYEIENLLFSKAFEEAKKTMTIEVFNDFLQDYPKSKLISDAVIIIDSLKTLQEKRNIQNAEFEKNINEYLELKQTILTLWWNILIPIQRQESLITYIIENKNFLFVSGKFININEKLNDTSLISIDFSNITSENIDKINLELKKHYKDLNYFFENLNNFHDFKTTNNFKELSNSIQGNENRIAKAKMDFNEVARQYNNYLKSYNSSINQCPIFE
jgi:LemA protein